MASKTSATLGQKLGRTRQKQRPLNWGLPTSVQWGLLFFLPLVFCGFWLYAKLSSLPSGAWEWTIYSGALFAAVALVPINWWLESFKWAELMPWARMPRRMREVLYGTAWSMIGPFRLGAGVGRVAAVRTSERNMAIRAFATASVAQWWCTITAAAFGLLCMHYFLAGSTVLFLSAVSLCLYLGWSPKFWLYLRNKPWMGDWGKSRKIPVIRRKRALSLSVLRFLVMVSQFILTLNAFGHLSSWGHDIDRFYAQGQGAVLTWGMTSLAPMPAFGDLGIREAAALFVIEAPNAADTTAIVGATLTLWIINLFIPSVVGLVWHAIACRERKGFLSKLEA